MQRGGIVDSVAHVTHDMAGLFERNDNALLLIGFYLGKDMDTVHLAEQRLIAQALNVGSGKYCGACQPQLLAHAGGDEAVVPGDYF